MLHDISALHYMQLCTSTNTHIGVWGELGLGNGNRNEINGNEMVWSFPQIHDGSFHPVILSLLQLILIMMMELKWR